ncbi:Clavaminate synthase-like protein [Teratosphaeria nubilosa]|uniref:Clavaminate synthase-like protein n=1 Tax=Teratosphaeria nubilosa TaxID=161662 RepID=A0A6G1LGD7_9PEZI|nr:Clavaminate synthase-like protein [Teratosphaeria nubilosa]
MLLGRALRQTSLRYLETFRNHAFLPAIPALLPRKAFKALPAHSNWFAKSADGLTLNRAHLARFGSTFFSAAPVKSPTAKIYLAQARILDLPQALRDDVPAPELVLKAGKGDVYDSSIWLGQAPTYTPLHRDPNPNLFIQLAGRKVVRLFRPEVGAGIFAAVQEQIGGSASATMRGEEMMQGEENNALEKEVWGEVRQTEATGWEAELGAGDGLFIPKGWWHSVKGIGSGMNGSVNWWFR